MKNQKRSGRGGNAARDPKFNLIAQNAYRAKGISKKRCTGFLHFDTGEVSIGNFRQQKGNKSTGLQSRCDLCNRLYFSIIQKPIKRLSAIGIWAYSIENENFIKSIPEDLKSGLDSNYEYWMNSKCDALDCNYDFNHGDYRQTAAFLTKFWSGREREDKISFVTDFKTNEIYKAPKFMNDLQSWAGAGGTLEQIVSTQDIWKWWGNLFFDDTAVDSSEFNYYRDLDKLDNVPQHPLYHFSWGAGNILSTTQGHSVPGFNQVKSKYKEIPRASSADNRVYSYLVEGDRLAMKQFSKECKKQDMSLGHFPAPLRWLGKDDPINGKPQPLKENIQQRDSLAELHKIAIRDPDLSGEFVSWQIRTEVRRLGEERVGFEEFTTILEAKVEEYLDSLLNDVEKNGGIMLKEHLQIADPGKTDTVYLRRFVKVSKWLKDRPSAKIKTTSEAAS